jgi:abhydrolase domain-containing protein 12
VNKTFNLQLNTPDNETLGAWFVMSEDYYKTIPSTERLRSEDQMLHAIQNYPTILFLHGNAATRAFHVRVQYYSTFTSRLGVNVLAIDYRGYGDSTGVPSEDGLITDGRAAFDWLVEHGATPEDILIVGHSLGTGVSGGLAARLSNDKVDYKGVVLLSPFSSITELLSTYHILGLVPLMSPLSVIPFAASE